MFVGGGIQDITNVADIKPFNININIVHLGKGDSDTQLQLVFRVVLVDNILYLCYLTSSNLKYSCFRLWVLYQM